MTGIERAPRTVLYIANGPDIGGGARVLTQAMTGLQPPFAPALVVPGEGTFSAWASSHDVPWHVAPSGGRAVVQGRMRTYRNALEMSSVARRAAVIHAEAATCFPSVGLVGRLLGVPRICHVQFPTAPGELAWALRFGAEMVVTVYERQAFEIRPDVPSDIPVVAIPNGIEVDHYAAEIATEASTKLREGSPHVAVLAGHVSEVKGYPTYLRAAAAVLQRFPGALFLCAGGETVGVGYTDRMRALAAELGIASRVRFLGAIPDVRLALLAADVFVLPSHQEGLPLAALEAMACGRPVVSTPVNGVPEAVVDGETGLLVSPGDHEALAVAVEALFADPIRRTRLGEAGRSRVRALFSVARVQARFNALYADLDGARRLRGTRAS